MARCASSAGSALLPLLPDAQGGGQPRAVIEVALLQAALPLSPAGIAAILLPVPFVQLLVNSRYRTWHDGDQALV